VGRCRRSQPVCASTGGSREARNGSALPELGGPFQQMRRLGERLVLARSSAPAGEAARAEWILRVQLEQQLAPVEQQAKRQLSLLHPWNDSLGFRGQGLQGCPARLPVGACRTAPAPRDGGMMSTCADARVGSLEWAARGSSSTGAPSFVREMNESGNLPPVRGEVRAVRVDAVLVERLSVIAGDDEHHVPSRPWALCVSRMKPARLSTQASGVTVALVEELRSRARSPRGCSNGGTAPGGG